MTVMKPEYSNMCVGGGGGGGREGGIERKAAGIVPAHSRCSINVFFFLCNLVSFSFVFFCILLVVRGNKIKNICIFLIPAI